tara:strand:- start:4017 stop:4298 length:282 start_codon:yes stop_codon:yes gene_type:complete
MIDTDKYKGHTSGSKIGYYPSGWSVEWVEPCTWYIRDPEVHLVGSEANRLLIQDAPLLLEEFKRLQDYNAALLHWVMYHLDKDEDEVKEMIYE